jgi:hypothetical protein
MKKVSEFPSDWHKVLEREPNAVRLLMDALGRRRGKKYELLSRPDEAFRERPAADFIYQDSKSGEQIAVEYTELNDPKVAEASSLLAHNKRLQRRGDIRPSELHGEQIGFREPVRVYPEDFASIGTFIATKIRRGQLQNTFAHERILLIYDASGIPEQAFPRWGGYEYGFERDSVHHAFLIVEQRQLYQLW